MNDYSRIIDHPHYRSKKRQHMSMMQRASQFSPFAALSGYDEAVNETARLTSEKAILEEDAVKDIDRMLRLAMLTKRTVDIEYYVPDVLKSGGSYLTVTGRIYKADMYEDVVIMEDGTAILMYNISDVTLQDEA